MKAIRNARTSRACDDDDSSKAVITTKMGVSGVLCVVEARNRAHEKSERDVLANLGQKKKKMVMMRITKKNTTPQAKQNGGCIRQPTHTV